MASESGIFQVQADLNIAVSDASVNAAAAQIKAKLDAALKPVDIKVTAQQSANVNRSLEAMTKNLKTIQVEATKVVNSFKAIGDTGVDAFRRAGIAKDAFRSNLTLLRRDLAFTEAQAARTGAALSKAFAGTAGSAATAPAAVGKTAVGSASQLAPAAAAIPLASVANLEKSIAAQIQASSIIPAALGSNIASGLKKLTIPAPGPEQLAEFGKNLSHGLEESVAASAKGVDILGGPLALAATSLSASPEAQKAVLAMQTEVTSLWSRIKNHLSQESGAISFAPFLDSFKNLGSGIRDVGGGITSTLLKPFKELFSVLGNLTPRINVTSQGIRIGMRGSFKAAKDDAAAFTKELKILSDQFSSGDISAKHFEQSLLKVTGKGKTRVTKGIFEEANLGALPIGAEKTAIQERTAAVADLNTQLSASGVAGGEASAGIGGATGAIVALGAAFVAFKTVKLFSGFAKDFENEVISPISAGAKAAQGTLANLKENLKLNLGQIVAPAFTAITQQLTAGLKDITPALLDFAKTLAQGLTGAAPLVRGLVDAFGFLVETINGVIIISKSVLSAFLDLFGLGTFTIKDFAKTGGDAIKNGLIIVLQTAKIAFEGILLPVRLLLEAMSHLPVIGKQAKLAIQDLDAATKDFNNGISDLGNLGKANIQQLIDPAKQFIQALLDSANGVQGIQNALVSAANTALDAAQAVKDQTKAVNDLIFQRSQTQRELNALTQDQGNILREQQNALIGIQDITANINALDLQRQDVLFNEQQRLQELQPTLEENNRKILESQLSQAAAVRAVADAQLNYNILLRESQFSQGVSLNLAGLSSQQIKAQLAQARAALSFASTPTFTETQAKNARDLAAAHDQVTGAVLAQEDASKNVLDAQLTQTKFIHDSKDAAINYQATLEGLNRQEQKAQNDKTEAQFQYGLLLSGQAGIHQQIIQLQHSQADQTSSLTHAQAKLTEAILIEKKAEADMRGDRAASLGYEQQILGVKNKAAPLDAAGEASLKTIQGSLTQIDGLWKSIQITLPGVFNPVNNLVDPTKSLAGYLSAANDSLINIGKTLPILAPLFASAFPTLDRIQTLGVKAFTEAVTSAVKAGTVNLPPAPTGPAQGTLTQGLQNILPDINPAFVNGGLLGVGSSSFNSAANLLQQAATALQAAGTDNQKQRDALAKLWRQAFGSAPPPFAEGGVVEGVNSAFGNLIRAGEYGRDELILPLQSGANKVWQLLAETLPKYPALRGGVAQLAPAASAATASISLATGRGGTGNADLDRKSNNKELAEAIVDAMEKRGAMKKEIHSPLNVNVSTPVQDPHILAKKIVDAQERALLRNLP